MGQGYGGVESDNPRRALERMRRAHARFQLGGVGRLPLEDQQAGIHDLGLCLRFLPE
ncbi:hypothetical protein D3C72_1057160 [compost metagenome]